VDNSGGIMEKSSGRRWFLKSVAAVGAIVPAAALGADPQSHHGHGELVAQAGSAKGQSQPQAYGWLTQPEQAFIEAAVARLIPADELGPGAKEAGVSYFIDQQLAGAYGTMARNYKQGPWPEGTAQQGYQSRLMPQEVYRAAIVEINAYCTGRYGKVFAALSAAQQDEVLSDLEAGKVALESVGASFFFGLLLANTMEGFFADPIYGGKHNVPYNAEPVSIADLQQHTVAVDEHGHPQHVLVAKKD
jgi:gluconate 2-dehydrogenase gamma chain